MMLEGCQPRRCAGFTLLEVMVSVVIFSIGILAVAGLQAISKRASFDAVQRTAAAQMANNFLERARVNSLVLADYLPGAPLGGGSRGAEPAPSCTAPASGCTASQLAAHDLWEWERALDGALETSDGSNTGGLVSPTACINGPVGGGAGIYSVAIAWRGVTPIDNPPINNCGAGMGKYGDGDAYRRVLVVQTFISPN